MGSTRANEGKLVGDFKDSKMHGQGAFNSSTGNRYVGE